LTVTSTQHRDVQVISAGWPSILLPNRQPYGVRAFDTVFSDEPSTHDGFGRAYEGYGIDPDAGCVIVTRPDQYIAGIYGLGDQDKIAMFFDRILVAV